MLYFVAGLVAGYAFRGLIGRFMRAYGPSLKARAAKVWAWLKSKV